MIYEAFYRWCKHQNKEVSYAGYAAMEAFLKQVFMFTGFMFSYLHLVAVLSLTMCCLLINYLLFVLAKVVQQTSIEKKIGSLLKIMHVCSLVQNSNRK